MWNSPLLSLLIIITIHIKLNASQTMDVYKFSFFEHETHGIIEKKTRQHEKRCAEFKFNIFYGNIFS